MKLHLDTMPKPRIEMLPLIDIVFLLLVVFIYAMLSMAVHRGLAVVLPKSTSTEIDKQLMVSVTVKADGEIYVDKQPTPLKQLRKTLELKTREMNQPGVFLFGERSLSYQTLFRVLDEIRLAGLNRISLQAEIETSP